jgi:hypothetical protein
MGRFGVDDDLPGVDHVGRGDGRAVVPARLGSQADRVGGAVGAEAAVVERGHLGRELWQVVAVGTDHEQALEDEVLRLVRDRQQVEVRQQAARFLRDDHRGGLGVAIGDR